MEKIMFLVACVGTIAIAVSARDCSRIRSIDNCDDCFRCGGKWCKNSKELDRCRYGHTPDDWCPNQIEQPKFMSHTVQGKQIPAYMTQTVKIGELTTTTIDFKTKSGSWNISILNSTQDAKPFHVVKSRDCENDFCTMGLEVTVGNSFCSAKSEVYEHTNVRIKVEGLDEFTDIKYSVPCACECSKQPEKSSDACSNHGDLVCGECICDHGWTGDRCQARQNRGDIPCSSVWNQKECSGNGECIDDACVCRNDTRGHQYLSTVDGCADICLKTEPLFTACEELENCYDESNLQLVSKDETLLEERDSEDVNNFVWVKCVVDVDGCQKQYAAKKDNGNDWTIYTLYVMPLTSCDPISVPQSGSTHVYVPVVLALLGVVAATVAVAGYLVWKNRSPPLPLTDPQYQNIDAEDCVGENPLYKPPTSSFKNPTYGKW